jgi:hypothetical protein
MFSDLSKGKSKFVFDFSASQQSGETPKSKTRTSSTAGAGVKMSHGGPRDQGIAGINRTKGGAMIPLKVHNVIDYIMAAFLIVSPWVFGFASVGAARNLFVIAGIVYAGYSLLTKYYYSAARIIPLGAHMTLDAALGVLLILAPALFGYREFLTQGQYAAHIVLGIGAVGLVALTRPRTEAAKTPAERAAIMHDVPLTP